MTPNLDPLEVARPYPPNVGAALVYLLISDRFRAPADALRPAAAAIARELARLDGSPRPEVPAPAPTAPTPTAPEVRPWDPATEGPVPDLAAAIRLADATPDPLEGLGAEIARQLEAMGGLPRAGAIPGDPAICPPRPGG